MKKMTRHIPSTGKKSAQDGLTRGQPITGTRRRDVRHIFCENFCENLGIRFKINENAPEGFRCRNDDCVL